MADDCEDFNNFAHRKGMINTIDEMIEFSNNVHAGRWPVRGALGYLKVLGKIAKGSADP